MLKMKTMLKILLAPLFAVLTVVTWLCLLLLKLSAFLLGLAAVIFAALGVFMLITGSTKNGVIVIILALVVSPVGIPLLAAHLLGWLQSLRYALQDRVYS